MNAQARTNARNRRARRSMHRAITHFRRNLQSSIKTAEAITGGRVADVVESHRIAIRVFRRFLSV